MKRIAYFTTKYLPEAGGLQYQTAYHLEAVDKLLNKDIFHNIEIHFLAPHKDALQYCRFQKIQVKEMGLKTYTKLGLIFNAIKLRIALKSIKPDLIHCQSIIPDGLIILLCNISLLNKYRYTITSHGRDLVVIPGISYGLRIKNKIKFLTKYILKNTDKLILPSHSLIPFALKSGANQMKIKVIPNGIKPVKKDEDKSLIYKIRRKWNIENNDLCLLSLSAFIPIKDLESLIVGLKKVTSFTSHVKLFLAGDGQLREHLKEKVKKLKLEEHIKFIGVIKNKEKDAYFRLCDVFCITSIFENFPVSLLEAMAYGKIIIATNVGGIQELIINDINGILVKPQAPNEIAQAIKRVYNNPVLMKILSDNTKKTSNKYHINNIATQYLDMYIQTI